jgi:hypothetical protein
MARHELAETRSFRHCCPTLLISPYHQQRVKEGLRRHFRRSTIASCRAFITIPDLTRSSLHRCLRRYGISPLPETEGDKPAKRKFKSGPIGYFHFDFAEVRTEEGKLYLSVAIDWTSKFAYAELHQKANHRWTATHRCTSAIDSQHSALVRNEARGPK